MPLPIQYSKGISNRQFGTTWPEGTFHDLLGRRGFFGKYASFFRQHAPTDWKRIEGNIKPRLFQSHDLNTQDMSDPGAMPTVLLQNNDVSIGISRRTEAMPYYFRNGDADELHFIHKGSGCYETDFGILRYREGDYIVIPRGITYRVVPSGKDNFTLHIESASEVDFPDRGLLGDWVPFDVGVVDTPDPQPIQSDGREHELRIKRAGEFTSVFYDFCPIDVVGWRGTLSVMRLNIEDIRPISNENMHVMPPAHCTFLNEAMMVCTYLPHPPATRSDAVRVPMYHRNIDYDEFTFMHGGTHFSRNTVTAGMITLHPGPIHHGPYRESIESSKSTDRFEIYAVAIDTVKPMRQTSDADRIEDKNYHKSWAAGG